MGSINFESFDEEQLQLCMERDRVLCSPEFARSPLMAKLLSYLIEHRLANDGTRLKAYTIAIDALDKPEDFDPQADSYPRVQIGRLRRMLAVFYGHEGGETRLDIPLGSYEIEIISNPDLQHAKDSDLRTKEIGSQSSNAVEEYEITGQVQPRSQTSWLNTTFLAFGSVLVVAIAAAVYFMFAGSNKLPEEVEYPSLTILETVRGQQIEDVSLARQVDNFISNGLYRFEGIKVLRGETLATVESDYYLKTMIGAGQVNEINLELRDAITQQIIWSDKVDIVKDSEELNRALSKLVVAVAGPYGAIASRERELNKNSYEIGYPCFLQLNSYLRYRDEGQLEPVLKCAKATVKAYPNDAYILSMAAFANYLSTQQKTAIKFDETVDDMAKRAIKLSPRSANANFAMARSSFSAGDCESGRKWGMAAYKLNPNDARLSGYLSIYLVSCGYPEGEKLANEAVDIDPNVDLAIVSSLAFYSLKRGDPKRAYEIATNYLTGAPRVEPSLLLVASLSAMSIGKQVEAKGYWTQITTKFNLPANSAARLVISQFIANPMLSARLIEAVREAKLAN